MDVVQYFGNFIPMHYKNLDFHIRCQFHFDADFIFDIDFDIDFASTIGTLNARCI